MCVSFSLDAWRFFASSGWKNRRSGDGKRHAKEIVGSIFTRLNPDAGTLGSTVRGEEPLAGALGCRVDGEGFGKMLCREVAIAGL